MSTLSACSNVVRLWRSFMASLSSASLRSSIRRSAAASCLLGWHHRLEICGVWKVMTINSSLTLAWTSKICLVFPFCLFLQVGSSGPLWLDKKKKKHISGGNHLRFDQIAVYRFLNSPGPFSLCLSISCVNFSFSLLTFSSRRFSSASCCLHCSCRCELWHEEKAFWERKEQAEVFR